MSWKSDLRNFMKRIQEIDKFKAETPRQEQLLKHCKLRHPAGSECGTCPCKDGTECQLLKEIDNAKKKS